MIDLDSSLADVAFAREVPTVDSNTIFMTDSAAKVRLSHSTFGLIHGCERKFQKTKLLRNDNLRDESAPMSFGKGFGAAWQLYFILRSEGQSVQVAQDSAIWELYKEYTPLLETDRHYLERAIYVLVASQAFLEQQLMEWEIAVFNGRYANELSFRLDINEKFYYVGYLDLVLKNRRTGRYAVTDAKTTSMRGEDLRPMYQFSDQVIGYSIILDKIVGADLAEFDTNYWVAQLPSGSISSLYQPRFHALNFQKTLRDRFEWFLKIYMDVDRLQKMEALATYPKRDNCMAYNKVCQFFGTCHFTTLDEPAIYKPDTIDYQFVYDIQDVFADHQKRLSA